MDRILFITTRNVLNTCGELRLIKNRTRTLFEKWDIKTEFVVICNKNKIISSNEEIGSNSTITSVVVNHNNPISIFFAWKRSKKLILKRIMENKYKCIILSGIGTLSFIPIIKTMDRDVKIVADIHGAKEELLEFFNGSVFKRLYRKFLYYYIGYSENKYLKQLDGALVVSNALAEYLNNRYKLSDFKHYIIPCAIKEAKFDLEIRNLNRELYRKKYSIEPDEILFIYSGGVSPWQCIYESVKIFCEIKSVSKLRAKMLILSHHIEQITPMIKDCKDIIIDRVPAENVNKILCAGDYAFLIRNDFVTNNVAYPNKFLEYVQSGMKIITTPFVFDVANQVKDFDLGVIINLDEEYEQILIDFITNMKSTDDSEKRNHLLHITSFEKTLEEFVEDFNLNGISVEKEELR